MRSWSRRAGGLSSREEYSYGMGGVSPLDVGGSGEEGEEEVDLLGGRGNRVRSMDFCTQTDKSAR